MIGGSIVCFACCGFYSNLFATCGKFKAINGFTIVVDGVDFGIIINRAARYYANATITAADACCRNRAAGLNTGASNSSIISAIAIDRILLKKIVLDIILISSTNIFVA